MTMKIAPLSINTWRRVLIEISFVSAARKIMSSTSNHLACRQMYMHCKEYMLKN